MKNPLIKRLPRELKRDIGKYIAIFLFLTATIGFVSGFLVADGSMKAAYDESFVKYNVEDGHFDLAVKVPENLELEKESVTVYENFYTEKTTSDGDTIRIYKNRNAVNLVCLMSGTFPSAADEIALDRLYAENNGIGIGDAIETDGGKYTVCGFVAFSDYSTLFKNNTDMMFDAQKFSVAIVSDEVFDSFTDSELHYRYSWKYDDQNLNDKQKNEKSEKILKVIAANAQVTAFVKRADNQAVMFTGDDMGQDKAMMTWMLYIVMAVLAFIFAVTSKSTIEQESAVIGTLRASGYKKGELLVHYLTLPLLVTLASAITGNMLGYTLFKNITADMYYSSYSLPTYTTIWNGEAFFMTTVIPCAIIVIVSVAVLAGILSLPPLAFLRRELKKNKKSKVIKLKRGSFISRFRLRVIFQNTPTYITMFIGILLADILLIFGMMMAPLLENYKTEVLNNQIANYQYILKAPVETSNTSAEKYCVTSLDTEKSKEEIAVFGIEEDSEYLSGLSLPSGEDEVVVSDGYMKKYSIKNGDKITLKDIYGDKVYIFTVKGSFRYPAALSVFMDAGKYRNIFGKDKTYFTGYFSDEELTDIDKAYIASVVTKHELSVVTDQLNDSMGGIMPLFCGFAILLFVLIIYLLSKLIIEKNASPISMVKILGYSGREVGRLYNAATATVIGFSMAVSIPAAYWVMKAVFIQIMLKFNGWLDFYIAPYIYPEMLVLGVVCYALVSFLQLRRIKKIPMSQALKNVE